MATSTQENFFNTDYVDWGLQQLEAVSRTFALSLQQLPEPLQTYSSTAYLLCRIPDTIEDTQCLSPEAKQSLLTDYAKTIRGEYSPEQFEADIQSLRDNEVIPETPDWQLAQETTKVFKLFSSFPEEITNAITPWVLELTDGMNEFVTRYCDAGGVRIHSYLELEEYCYYVAGTVGHLLTDLLATRYNASPPDEIHTAAEEYGLVLQFVNIAKDVYDDYTTENNIYLPLKELATLGVNDDTLLDEANEPQVGRVVTTIVSHAERYSNSAHAFLEWLSSITPEQDENDVFASMALPYLLAIATLREVKANPKQAVYENEVKINRFEVMAITSEVTNEPHPNIETLVSNIKNGEYMQE